MPYDLRGRVVRLAHTRTDLRPHLLPLLREGTDLKKMGGKALTKQDWSSLDEGVWEVDGIGAYLHRDVRYVMNTLTENPNSKEVHADSVRYALMRLRYAIQNAEQDDKDDVAVALKKVQDALQALSDRRGYDAHTR